MLYQDEITNRKSIFPWQPIGWPPKSGITPMSSVDTAPVVVPLALTAPLPLSSPLVLPELLVLVELPEVSEPLEADVIGCGPLVKPDDATVSPHPDASSRAAPTRASRRRTIGRSCLVKVGFPHKARQDPRSNRACGFPAHGLPMVSRSAALRSLRVLDGPTQAMEPVAVEEVASPTRGSPARRFRPLRFTMKLRSRCHT
jgi:hypothetical protein